MERRNNTSAEDATWEALSLTKTTEIGVKIWSGDHDAVGYGYSIPNYKSNRIVYQNAKGERHRLCGPAVQDVKLGLEMWYADGELHRDDGGPAYTYKHIKKWYQNGKLHRIDGPAVIGQGRPREYWLEGIKLSPREHKKEVARRSRKGLLDV